MPLPLQLFEMGLELSFARLKALAKFAFGMGLTQVHPLRRHHQTLLSPRSTLFTLLSPEDPPRVLPDKAASAAASCCHRRCSVRWFRLVGPFEKELPRRGGGHGRARVGPEVGGGVASGPVARAVPYPEAEGDRILQRASSTECAEGENDLLDAVKSVEEWQAVLLSEQFRILRQKGTEYPGTGEYDKFFEEGVYNCAGCGTLLHWCTTKFNTGCGWPAFYEGLPGAITCTVCSASNH